MIEQFFFGVLPYLALLLFFGVPIYRAYRREVAWSARGEFSWTTRASGFFGKRVLGAAAILLHWGLFLVIIGHVLGLIGILWGPLILLDIFHWMGLAGGMMLFHGLLIALARRLFIKEVWTMSQREDYVILLFLLVIVGLSLWQVIVDQIWGVSASVWPWFASIARFEPDLAIISGATLVTKVHVAVSLAFFCYFPFTKLVHAWSFPFGYITRPYISMRSYGRWAR